MYPHLTQVSQEKLTGLEAILSLVCASDLSFYSDLVWWAVYYGPQPEREGLYNP